MSLTHWLLRIRPSVFAAVVLVAISCLFTVNTASASVISKELRNKLVKVPGSSSLYYVDNEGMRHLFTSESIFWTYYTGSWNKLIDRTENKGSTTITAISQDQFDQLPLGINMVPSSESIIRFNNSAVLYKSSYDPTIICEIPKGITKTEKDKINKTAVVVPSSFASDYEYVYNNTSWCNDNIVTGTTAVEIMKKYTTNPSPEVIISNEMLAEKSRKLASGKEYRALGYDGVLLLKEYAHAIKNKDWDAVNKFRVNPIETSDLKDKNVQKLLDAYADLILKLDPSEFGTVSRDLNNLVASTDVYSSQATEGGLHAIAGVKYSATFKFDNGTLKIGEFIVWTRTTLIANMSEDEAKEYVKKELADDDGDGLITAFEDCQGIYAQANTCSKTNGFTRDSDGDGYWDGLLDYNSLVK